MVEINFHTQNSQENTSMVKSQQVHTPDVIQGTVVARPATVAPPAPGNSVQSTLPVNRILRLPEVRARVGICRASIYQHMAQGSFPRPVALGLRARGWLEHEIDAWLTVRIRARQTTKKI